MMYSLPSKSRTVTHWGKREFLNFFQTTKYECISFQFFIGIFELTKINYQKIRIKKKLQACLSGKRGGELFVLIPALLFVWNKNETKFLDQKECHYNWYKK